MSLLIDVFKLGKYLFRKSDATVARVGHVNYAINTFTPVTGLDSPITLEIVPEFTGQLFIDTENEKAYISTSLTHWQEIPQI